MKKFFARISIYGLLGPAILLLCMGAAPLMGQQKVKGTVMEIDSSERLYEVHVVNRNTGAFASTGHTGDFEISARSGDTLAFVKEGFYPQNLPVQDPALFLKVYLGEKPIPPSAELLPEVTVYGKSYLEDSLRLREEYSRFFPSEPPELKDMIGSSGSLDLNAWISRIMTPWDKEFSERLLAYEQKKYIDKVYTAERVRQVVDIPDAELEEFIKVTRPSYFFLQTASEYDLVKYIRDAYLLYRQAKYGETLKPAD